MGKSVRLDHEFDKKKFAKLIKDAIGNDTVIKYTQKCGVSWATLTRYLNAYQNNPPTPNTIIKIANASEGRVPAYFLLSAAGYEPFRYIESSTSNTQYMAQLLSEIFYLSKYSNGVIEHTKAYNASFIVNMNTDLCPFETWIFKILETSDISSFPASDFKNYLGSQLFNIPPNSKIKISIVVDSIELFSEIQAYSLEYDIFVTIVLIDSATMTLIKEEPFKTNAISLHPEYNDFTIKSIGKFMDEL